jgi:tRNA dimethylallyltransferase
MSSSVVSGDDLAPQTLDQLAALVDAGRLVTIVGPTASGKTDLAARLAERVGAEVVNADSVQVYRHFDVGSGKPTEADLGRAPHHLVGVRGPLEPIDAAGYAALASAVMDEIRMRGKRVVVCGGTFLWVKALAYGLAEAPSANADVRARHRAIADAEGRPALHRKLGEVDSESAARLHPNDFVRVSRALEVFELTGVALSGVQRQHGFREERHPVTLVAMRVPADVLSTRIDARVRAWLGSGWIEEVDRLLRAGYGGARAMGSVGYREVAAHVRGDLPRDRLAEAIVRSTRVFARRQRTWLNHADVTFIEPLVDAQR